jgi:hypothetical protein
MSLRALEFGLILRGIEFERDDGLADSAADVCGTEERT